MISKRFFEKVRHNPRAAWFSALMPLVAGILFPVALHAGAWTQDARHGQVITTFEAFRTSHVYDDTGSVKEFPDNGVFQQLTLNPYLEYGLTSRYTLNVNIQIPFLEYSNKWGSVDSAGLGDIEMALQARLNGSESPWAVSGEFLLKFPAYSENRNPAPGNHQEDIEARFMVGRGGTLVRRHVFWDAEVAFRARFGAPADQVRFDLTAGMDLSKHVMAMAQFFNTRSLRNGEPLEVITNPNAQSDYDLHKCQVSAVFALPHKTKIQIGWNSTLAGRNTGREQGAIISLWKAF